MVRVRCSHCPQVYQVPKERLGKQATCKKCQHTFTLEMAIDETKSPSPRMGDTAAFAIETTALPQKLGQYILKHKLGAGAMGEVWLAHDPALERDAALKLMSPGIAADPERRQRFEREAKAAARLAHTNTVGIYSFGIEGQHAYLAMELVVGVPLDRAVSEGGPLPWREATRVICDAARGLTAAHEIGLVHRDIKPANLMRTTKGVTKVVDFGLAREIAANTQLTQAGSLLGTPAFMAPEQWMAGEVDGRSDLYSLICTYYYLLTARLPFQAPSLPALGYQHRYEAFPDPRQSTPSLPDSVCRILARGAQKDPAERYQTGAELVAELEALLSASAESMLFNAPWESLSAISGPAPSAAAGPNSAVQAVPRKPWWQKPIAWAAGGAAAFVLLLSAVVFLLQTKDGVLRIEINDPQIEVKIKGTEIVLKQADQSQEVRLTPGEKTLRVERGDFSFETDKLILKKGATVTVQVELLAGKIEVRSGDQLLGARPLPAQPEPVVRPATAPPPAVAAAALPGQSSIRIVNSPPEASPAALARSLPGQPQSWPADAPPAAIAPYDAAQAKKHQEAWARYLGLPVEYTNTIGMKFRLIPPGEFQMGSTAEQVDSLKTHSPHEAERTLIPAETPRHQVVLTDAFYLGAHEVTQKQYETVTGQQPSRYAPAGENPKVVVGLDTHNFPVEQVSWNDAVEFCVALSAAEQHEPFYTRHPTISVAGGPGYRLPTEAQWEYSCRAGTETLFWTGDSERDAWRAAWCFPASGQKRTNTVGSLEANPFGLFDVHGNVFEWCHDAWAADSYSAYENEAAVNPVTTWGMTAERVLRGGHFFWVARSCRAARRRGVKQDVRFVDYGFRASLSTAAVKAALQRPGSNGSLHTWPAAISAPADLPAAAQAPAAAIAPFAATQAKQYQQAWANHLKAPVEYTNTIGMKFSLIPPGEFMMGSSPEEIEAGLAAAVARDPRDARWRECVQSEGPRHKVVLTKPFYLGVHEVTQSQYEQVLGKNPADFSPKGERAAEVAGVDTTAFPVENVSWNDAAEFSALLSQREKLPPAYFRSGSVVTALPGHGYRLPTEAEWEFACRAGTTTWYWTGDTTAELALAAWYDENSGRKLHPVGQLPANPFGLYDIHGGLYEWVQDGWDPTWYEQFRDQPAIDPAGPTAAKTRVMRGGANLAPPLPLPVIAPLPQSAAL